MCDENPSVKEAFRDLYEKHRPYNALAFTDFMSTVAGTKNMLTRKVKGSLSCPLGVLVNNFVMLANVVGPDVRIIFETPAISEPHYKIVRSILHHIGLPYEAGEMDVTMNDFFRNLDYQMRRHYE